MSLDTTSEPPAKRVQPCSPELSPSTSGSSILGTEISTSSTPPSSPTESTSINSNLGSSAPTTTGHHLPLELVSFIFEIASQHMSEDDEKLKEKTTWLSRCCRVSKSWRGQIRRLLWNDLYFGSHTRARSFVLTVIELKKAGVDTPKTCSLHIDGGKIGDEITKKTTEELLDGLHGITYLVLSKFDARSKLDWRILEASTLVGLNKLSLEHVSFCKNRKHSPPSFPFTLEMVNLCDVSSTCSSTTEIGTMLSPKHSLAINYETLRSFGDKFNDFFALLSSDVADVHYLSEEPNEERWSSETNRVSPEVLPNLLAESSALKFFKFTVWPNDNSPDLITLQNFLTNCPPTLEVLELEFLGDEEMDGIADTQAVGICENIVSYLPEKSKLKEVVVSWSLDDEMGIAGDIETLLKSRGIKFKEVWAEDDDDSDDSEDSDSSGDSEDSSDDSDSSEGSDA